MVKKYFIGLKPFYTQLFHHFFLDFLSKILILNLLGR
jgi:hypothetical protein